MLATAITFLNLITDSLNSTQVHSKFANYECFEKSAQEIDPLLVHLISLGMTDEIVKLTSYNLAK